jgi:hypothetical protein
MDLYERHAHDYVADRRLVGWNESAWLDQFTVGMWLPCAPAAAYRLQPVDAKGILERETRLELATSTLARLRSTN